MSVRQRLLALVLVVVALAGCGATTRGPVEPPKLTLADVAPPNEPYPLLVSDPLEPINRAIYTFNAGFDRYVLLPVVRGYVTVTPDYRFRVSRKLKEEFDNGEPYYPLEGQVIALPKGAHERPDPRALEWHADSVFRA